MIFDHQVSGIVVGQNLGLLLPTEADRVWRK